MKKRILSAMLALIMLMTMVVSMPVKAEAYELTVNNIHWGTGDSEKILSWDPVEGATRYYVSCGSGGGYYPTTSANLAYCIKQSGTYTPTVTAYNGDIQLTEETDGPSKDFVLTPLETPTNVVVDFENGTITWNPVANAVEYYVALYGYNESYGYDCRSCYETSVYSSTPNAALSNFASRFVDGQEYYFGIRAYDRTYNYGTSDFGHSVKFTYTAPVLPTVQNIHWGTGDSEKILSWDPVDGATKYYVSCGSGGGEVEDNTSKDLAFCIKQSGTYTPTVTAYNGDVQITEETTGPSKDFVLTPLDTPTNVVADVDSGTVTWNDVPNATQYYVALYSYNESYGYDCRSCYETSVYSNTPNAAMSSFASRLIDGQEYYFGIRAYDRTYHYGYSDFGHSEKFTYVTKYDVTTSVFGEGGTVSPSQRIEKGGDVTIALTPDAGYVVSYLQVNGVDVTSSMVGNTYTISDVQGNKTVVAQFSRCHHEWGTGTVTKEATCKEAGTREYTCSICHDTKEETIAKLTTHTWDGGVVTTAPTCKDTGIMTYTCTVCEMTRTEIIGATGVHTYGAYTTTTEPTCVNTGIETRYCTVCNAKDEKTIPTVDHTAQNVEAIAPTCTESGKTAGTICSVCKAVLAGCEDDPAPGHTVVIDKAVAATYAKTGLTEGSHCSVCGKVIKAQEVIPKLTPTAPAAPTLSISKADGKITISWNAVSGANKYWIYRSTDGTNFKYYDSTTKTSYTNSSVTSGTKYYYKVKAVKTVDGTDYASSYSAAKSTIPMTTPTLSISKTAGKIKLSWGSVTGATKYWIYRSTDGVNFKYYDSTTNTSYTNSSVTSGTKYYYKVKAVKNVNGTDWVSSYSAVKSTVPMTTPTLSATLSSGKIKLSWGSVTGATKYWIYRSTDGKNFSYYDSTTNTSYTNSSVTAGKTYYYKIKAVKTISSTDWASDYSNVVSKKP